MNKQQAKFKLGTADTLLLAVGTLAVDFICTSKSPIVEVQPGGKKVYNTLEELEEKIKRYGIKKGDVHPGSSLGNFISQAQEITKIDPNYAPVHLVTTLAPEDPSTKLLLDSLKEKGIRYEVTPFTGVNAANPTALLVESEGYTKILSFKDKHMPAIEIKTPEKGIPGLVIIGAAAGDAVQSKTNALEFAKKHDLPIGVMTTEAEINQLTKNTVLRAIFNEVLSNATFFAANEDEIRKIILAEKPNIKPSHDKIELAMQLREVVMNDDLDILLTYGAEGSIMLLGDTAIIQHVPKIPRKDIVSTSGAGDALAGAFVEGVRIKGMDLEGIKWALPRASRASQNVLKYADTRTGQFTAEQFMEEPPPEYEIEIIDVKK